MDPSKKNTVLVVDVDPIRLTAVAAVLYAAQFECICARSLVAAEKALADGPIDLMVLDVGDDVKEIVQLISRAVDTQTGEVIPTILLSEPTQTEQLKNLVAGETIYFLVKPFDPKTLMELAKSANWMPHLVSKHRQRGQRPTTPGWVSL